MPARSRPSAEPRRVVHLRLTAAEHEELRVQAAQEGVSMSRYVLTSLDLDASVHDALGS